MRWNISIIAGALSQQIWVRKYRNVNAEETSFLSAIKKFVEKLKFK